MNITSSRTTESVLSLLSVVNSDVGFPSSAICPYISLASTCKDSFDRFVLLSSRRGLACRVAHVCLFSCTAHASLPQVWALFSALQCSPFQLFLDPIAVLSYCNLYYVLPYILSLYGDPTPLYPYTRPIDHSGDREYLFVSDELRKACSRLNFCLGHRLRIAMRRHRKVERINNEHLPHKFGDYFSLMDLLSFQTCRLQSGAGDEKRLEKVTLVVYGI